MNPQHKLLLSFFDHTNSVTEPEQKLSKIHRKDIGPHSHVIKNKSVLKPHLRSFYKDSGISYLGVAAGDRGGGGWAGGNDMPLCQ